MSEQNRINRAERALETVLRQLQPVAPGHNTDQMLFNAGRACGTRARRPWQAATTILVLLLAGTLALRPRAQAPVDPGAAPRYVDAAVTPPPQAAVSSDTPAKASSYLRLRQSVLERGVDALPAGPRAAGDEVRAADRDLWLEDEEMI